MKVAFFVLLLALVVSVAAAARKEASNKRGRTLGRNKKLAKNLLAKPRRKRQSMKKQEAAKPKKKRENANELALDMIPDKYEKHTVSVFSDKFDDSKLTKKQWAWPAASDGAMGNEQLANKPSNFFFSGDMSGKAPLRTKEMFDWPLTVTAQIEKDHKCSSHFIVISTSDKFTWDWSASDDAIKFVWNCDTKYILAKGQPKSGAKGAKCAKKGKYEAKVVVKGGVVSFEDDQCETLTARNLMQGQRVYVYIGADQDTPGMKSKFFSVDISQPPKPGPLPPNTVFGDDFTFMHDTRPKMWQRRQIFAKVDNGCGSMPGSPDSLRFTGAKRSVTSQVMDMHRGGSIETCARYGSDKYTKTWNTKSQCQPLDDLDGMEIQWSADGKKFKRLARYIAHQFAEQFQGAEFNCVKHHIDWKQNPELMIPTLYLRWVQISEIDRDARRRIRPGAVRGNFALGKVLAISKPEPAAEVVMKDTLSVANTNYWKYPPTGIRDTNTYGYELGSLFFKGGLEGKRMMRTRQAYGLPLKLKTTVDKSSKCSNHIVGFSTKKDQEWTGFKSSKGMWKFVWNCNFKYIYAPDGRVAKVQCPRDVRYDATINVEKGAVIFKDNGCKDLVLPVSPNMNDQMYVYIGADDKDSEKSRFMNFEISKLAGDVGSTIDIFEQKLLDADFKYFDEKAFKAPVLTASKSATFGFFKEGAVWFSGDFSGQTPMRSVSGFPIPFAVSGQLTKTDECSSQFIVISADPKFQWGWGPSKNAIKFAWNCDDKYIYGTNKKQVTKMKCAKKGDYKFQIQVFDNMIQFGDDECGMLNVKNGLAGAKELFVYIGADQDQPGLRSKFNSLTVTGPFVPPTIKDRRVLMQDNFDFKDSLYEPMWTVAAVTGRADKQCGAVFGNALHFANGGPRVATTKAVDASKGLRVDFALRFGGSSLQCGKMTGPSDGVEVQASADGGKNWKRLIRYDNADYGKMLSTFKRLSVTLDENTAPDLLTDATMIRWIQPQNNKACCGHWAIDNVALWTLEEPGEIIIDDSFGKPNASAWVFPVNEKGACQYGMENNIWFSGDCSGRTPMHSKRLLTAKQGVTITADVDKDAPCSNHFFAISPSKHLRWVAGKPQHNVIKIGWNCDEKYIMTGKTRKSMSCGAQKKFEVTIKITKGEISFVDNVCEGLTFPVPVEETNGPFYVFMGADRFDTKSDGRSKFGTVTIEQAAADPFDKFTVPIYSDDFLKENKALWVYPPHKQNAEKRSGACFFNHTEGAVQFHGDCVGASPMRLKDAVKMPVTIFADADKTAECSSHYVVISPLPNYKWSWEPQPHAIKFAWNCDDKYIYGMQKKEQTKIKCAQRGNRKISVAVEDGLLTFKDGQCAALTMKNPFNATEKFFIYIGADQDEKNMVSEFTTFSVEAPEEPPKLDDVTVMFDNFDFHDNMYAPNWLKEETTGRVDKECGSVNGKSLRFFNAGVRRASSKLLDLSYGANINFFMKFGAGEGPGCMMMNDFKDGVTLQYRTETSGKTNETTEGMWKTLQDYSVATHGAKFRKGFANVSTIIINWDKYPDAMTEKTRLRWIQHDENARPCCDHWALDNVVVKATPHPRRPIGLSADTLIEDSFDEPEFGANAVWWNMFECTGRPSSVLTNSGQSMLVKGKGERMMTV